MRLKKYMQMAREGAQEAIELGLDEESNWTPLLIHIHVSRMLVGGFLGLIVGFLFGVICGLLVR